MIIENGDTPTIVFLMVDSSDSETAETGVSPTVYVSKAGGAFAASTNSAAEIGRGWYSVELTATETNTDGALVVEAEATGCEVQRIEHQILTTLSAVLSSAERNAVADHVLRRGFASAAASSDGDAKSFRSLLGTVAKAVNKVSVSGATLTVYEADDTTALGTQTLTTGSGDPITGVDTD